METDLEPNSYRIKRIVWYSFFNTLISMFREKGSNVKRLTSDSAHPNMEKERKKEFFVGFRYLLDVGGLKPRKFY